MSRSGSRCATDAGRGAGRSWGLRPTLLPGASESRRPDRLLEIRPGLAPPLGPPRGDLAPPAESRVRLEPGLSPRESAAGPPSVSPDSRQDLASVTSERTAEALARAEEMTEFFRPLVPGQLGCVFDQAAPGLVVGHIDVTETLIAGTGYLFAPAVVALADTCAAIGCRANISDNETFTTIELKSNFVSSARTGEKVVCRYTPAHLGRQTQVWDATVTNETTGRTMALFRCTQIVLQR